MNRRDAELRRRNFFAFLESIGYGRGSIKELAREAGISPNTIYNYDASKSGREGTSQSLSQDTVIKILKAIRRLTGKEWIMEHHLFEDESAVAPRPQQNVTLTELPSSAARPMPRDLPVLATSANTGGKIKVNEHSIVDRYRRPTALEGIEDAYAAYMAGESMLPHIRSGELLVIHPHRPSQPGDYVMIRLFEGPDAGKAYVGILISQSQETITFRQGQNDQSFTVEVEDNGAEVHKILTTSELLA